LDETKTAMTMNILCSIALSTRRYKSKIVIQAEMSKPRKKKPESNKSRIFLVEDHPVFREGFSTLLRSEESLTLCGEAGNATEALKSIIKLKPDLAVVDLGLPGKSGLELIKEIRALKLPVKLLVVSMFDEAIYAQRVLRAGGDGYVMKQEDPEVIVLAIQDVLAGHIYVSEDVFDNELSKRPFEKKAASLDLLTDSEIEVLELIGEGKNKHVISLQAGLSDAEVTTHCNSIRRKLKLESNDALIHYAACWVADSVK
jgi:DNA-binding NarL/FixJ family response regulator